MRIATQSIGRLQNATMLGGATGDGTPEFFELLRVLRQLQLAGELSIHYKNGNSQAVMFSLGISGAPSAEAAADMARVRSLLQLTTPTSIQSTP